MEDLIPFLQVLLVPVLGWIATGLSKLNKTLSNLDKNLAVVENKQNTHNTDIKKLFDITDKLQERLSELWGKCNNYHGSDH